MTMKKLFSYLFLVLFTAGILSSVAVRPTVVNAQASQIDCSRPTNYTIDRIIDIQPIRPKEKENFSVNAIFTFKDDFLAKCVALEEAQYYYKFEYDDYGGSLDTEPQKATFSGKKLEDTDVQTWDFLIGDAQPTSTRVRVRVGLYAVNKLGGPYEDGAAFQTGVINFDGITLTPPPGGGGAGGGGGVGGNPLNPPVGGGGNTAGSSSPDLGKTFYNPINIESIPEFIVRIINILLILTGMLAVLFIIIGGLRYITSAGNPQNATGAKNTILYAIFGLAFAVLSYAIVNVITNVLINK